MVLTDRLLILSGRAAASLGCLAATGLEGQTVHFAPLMSHRFSLPLAPGPLAGPYVALAGGFLQLLVRHFVCPLLTLQFRLAATAYAARPAAKMDNSWHQLFLNIFKYFWGR